MKKKNLLGALLATSVFILSSTPYSLLAQEQEMVEEILVSEDSQVQETRVYLVYQENDLTVSISYYNWNESSPTGRLDSETDFFKSLIWNCPQGYDLSSRKEDLAQITFESLEDVSRNKKIQNDLWTDYEYVTASDEPGRDIYLKIPIEKSSNSLNSLREDIPVNIHVEMSQGMIKRDIEFENVNAEGFKTNPIKALNDKLALDLNPLYFFVKEDLSFPLNTSLVEFKIGGELTSYRLNGSALTEDAIMPIKTVEKFNSFQELESKGLENNYVSVEILALEAKTNKKDAYSLSFSIR